jgi:hypothetical protein
LGRQIRSTVISETGVRRGVISSRAGLSLRTRKVAK